MRIRILSSAFQDLVAGRKFYDKIEEGLGDYFFDSLFSDIDSLVIYGGVHQRMFGHYRMLAKRFPFAIYYKVGKDETVIVWRVLDLRQHPPKLRNALMP